MVKGKGWLQVVGTGLRIGQLTQEAHRAVVEADVVFGLVTNRLALAMLADLNPNMVDLSLCYVPGIERLDIYREMATQVLSEVRAGRKVCLAVYGHPGVFADPSRLAIGMARQEGYQVAFLPGISTEDSLFCDLEVDPAWYGCQIYSATQFIFEDRPFDPRSLLTLWQVGIIGESRHMDHGNHGWFNRLCDRLESIYPPTHPVVLYEASTNPFFGPDISWLPLSRFREIEVRACCTVVIPPIHRPDLIKVPMAEKPRACIEFPSAVRTAVQS